MALIALAFSGGGLLDLKGYFLSGVWENLLAWASFILVFIVPVIALLTAGPADHEVCGRSATTWAICLPPLWVIGLISFVVLAGMLVNNFRARAHSEEDFALTQPSHGSLIIRAHQNIRRDYYDDDWWFGNGWRHNGVFYSISEDSILLNTIQIKVLRSEDSGYHVRILRGSLGATPTPPSIMPDRLTSL